MNKKELIDAVAAKTETTKKATGEILDALFETLAETMSAGDEVRIPQFGIFRVSERGARSGRNPQTGEEIAIPARKMPVFKAAANLKEICK